MSKNKNWEEIAFSDIKMGDKIRYVSATSGTKRKGAVKNVGASWVKDSDDAIIAWRSGGKIERRIKTAKTTMPEIGQRVRVEYRFVEGGPIRVREGVVTRGTKTGQWFVGDDYVGYLPQYACTQDVTRIVSWTPAPQEEPTQYGYVGTLTLPSGEIEDVTRDEDDYTTVNTVTGAFGADTTWTRLLARGTFTEVTR